MSRSFLVLLFVLYLPGASRSLATELTDLGQGLAYLRVASLAESARAIAAVVPEPRPLVLDLRYATADAEGAGLLRDALSRRTAVQPLLVLVSPATPGSVAAALSSPPSSLLLLGIAGSAPAPAVVVRQSAEADRLAYDAATQGTPLAALVSGRIGKERYDEASLARDFANGHRDPAPPTPPDPTALPAGPATVAAPPSDRVLQRAINLHRALLAIRAH